MRVSRIAVAQFARLYGIGRVLPTRVLRAFPLCCLENRAALPLGILHVLLGAAADPRRETACVTLALTEG